MNLITRTTLAISLAALSVGAAQAIDKCTPKLLMDNGFGSAASDGWTDYSGFDPEINIVGSKNDALGRSMPTSWRYDPASGLVTEFGMPALDFRGSCSAGRGFSNGSDVAVGQLIAPNGSTHAVVWRRGIMAEDDWEAPVALAPGATASICGHEIAHGVQADVAGAILQEGRWRPVVFIKVNVDIAHTLLPMPAGAQGQGLTIEGDPGSRTVGGWVQMPGGRRRPVLWIEASGGWTLTPVSVLAGVSGQIDDVSSLFNAGFVGTQFRNGRTMGFFSVDPAQQGSTLLPLEGFQNSRAYGLGDTGTHEIGHIWGDSSSDGVDELAATLWLRNSEGLFAPFPVQQFLMEPGTFEGVTSCRPSQDAVVGSVIPGGSILSQACLFLPSGNQAVDRIDLRVGNELGGDVGSLVHNDGELYGVRTERVNGQRMACVDLQFNPLSFTAGQDARMDAQVMVPNQVTGGTINVYVYNHTTQQFDSIYSNNMGGGLLGISAALPSSNEWQHPQTGQIILRLEFKHSGNAPRTIGIESVEIAYEG